MKCSVLSCVAQAWKSTQVELHGQYSVERLYQMKAYCDRATPARVAAVFLLTPIPCLSITLAIECIPLRDPSLGLQHYSLMWVRGIFFTTIVDFLTLYQCRYVIPTLPESNFYMILSSFIAAIVSGECLYAMARVIGFPVPFTIILASPISPLILGGCIILMWGKFFRQHPEELPNLISYLTIVSMQLVMAYVYPAYAFAFVRIPGIWQVIFALLLPFIKRAVKSCISFLFRHKPDLKPNMIVLNADMYHVLFVSWCMNGSRSTFNIILFVLLDFVESVMAIHNVGGIFDDIKVCLRSSSTMIARELPKSDQSIDLASLDGISLPCVAIAIWESNRYDPKFCADIQLRSDVHTSTTRNSQVTIVPYTSQSTRDAFHEPPLHACSIIPDSLKLGNTSKIMLANNQKSNSMAAIKTIAGERMYRALSTVSTQDQLECLQLILKLLHITEFLMLIEFIEAIVPAIYCLYLLGIYHLPNRMFFDNVRDLTELQLRDQLSTIAVYSLLELVSFLLLSFVLQRKLGISPLRQLSFMLESQWEMTQSKLVLWVLFAVQSRLQHYGTDFTFQFKWLSNAGKHE